MCERLGKSCIFGWRRQAKQFEQTFTHGTDITFAWRLLHVVLAPGILHNPSHTCAPACGAKGQPAESRSAIGVPPAAFQHAEHQSGLAAIAFRSGQGYKACVGGGGLWFYFPAV